MVILDFYSVGIHPYRVLVLYCSVHFWLSRFPHTLSSHLWCYRFRVFFWNASITFSIISRVTYILFAYFSYTASSNFKSNHLQMLLWLVHPFVMLQVHVWLNIHYKVFVNYFFWFILHTFLYFPYQSCYILANNLSQ